MCFGMYLMLPVFKSLLFQGIILSHPHVEKHQKKNIKHSVGNPLSFSRNGKGDGITSPLISTLEKKM